MHTGQHPLIVLHAPGEQFLGIFEHEGRIRRISGAIIVFCTTVLQTMQS
jgi:hypothetical protein